MRLQSLNHSSHLSVVLRVRTLMECKTWWKNFVIMSELSQLTARQRASSVQRLLYTQQFLYT